MVGELRGQVNESPEVGGIPKDCGLNISLYTHRQDCWHKVWSLSGWARVRIGFTLNEDEQHESDYREHAKRGLLTIPDS